MEYGVKTVLVEDDFFFPERKGGREMFIYIAMDFPLVNIKAC